MKKAERIKRYGEEAYEKHLAQTRAWYKAHREEEKVKVRAWREENPEKERAIQHEKSRKGGKCYDKKLEYNKTGIPGEKMKIRRKHNKEYKPFKDIIAPDSQIHHEWIPQTAEYRGVALVEKDPHQYGIIDVIQILDGKITLLTEEAVRNRLKEKKVKNEMTEKKENKGRYLQLHYYVSDADEALIFQAGVEVGRFLDIAVQDAVKHAKMNLGVE